MKIILSNRDELYWIRIEDIAYIQADDHYSAIFMVNGTKQVVPFGLSQFCEILSKQVAFEKLFIRINRSFILGITNIYSVSITKGIVIFSQANHLLRLTIPKDTLRKASSEIRKMIHEISHKSHEE